MNEVEVRSGIAVTWAEGDRKLNDFYSYIDANEANISLAKSFGDISWHEVFNIKPQGLYGKPELKYHNKGEYNVFDEKFYDLTTYFPALL